MVDFVDTDSGPTRAINTDKAYQLLRVSYGKEAGLLFLIAPVTLLVARLVSSLVFVFF
jgi:hypothetical protein